MNLHPTKLERRPDGRLRIEWSNGERRDYALTELREACPCATCREKRQEPATSSLSLPILSAAEARPLSLEGMQPVGNYAYSIRFSDGHDTGIYTFELLRELGTPVTT
jgi:DUF971 family protein